MRKARNLSSKLTAMLPSMTMLLGPVFESVPVYAAEVQGDAAETMQETADSTTADGADVTAGNLLVEAEPVWTSQKAMAFTDSDLRAGGWNESIYAEIAGATDAAVTKVEYSGTMNGELTDEDLTYLVRDITGGVRIDIPGLKKGTYTLKVTVGGTELTQTGIEVYEYDRSGYAHFNYTSGVGAYNNDGTLKDNAIVLYVTNGNKNTVSVTSKDGTTVTGIGNILNSVGQDRGGTTSNGGTPNSNKGIIQKLAQDGTPLVVRFIGTVSDSGLYEMGTFNAASACLIEGLTKYNSTDQGGSVGDNGHMARMQSGKDITLEGIGYDATIDGWGFHFISEGAYPNLGESFEVRNLTFINTPEDAVGMEGQQASKNASSAISSSVERCWIHNNEFYCPSISSPAESDKSEGDGSVDFKRGQYFTCSYNYFEGCHKTNLVGSADYSLQFNLSYHHNWWFMCKARGPLTRRANVHMYNNIVDMQTDYAQNTRADAYIFSEYNIFYACKSPQAVEGGAIKSYNDVISSVIWNKGSPATTVTDKSTTVTNNCQYAYAGINYSKFDTESDKSYIPNNDYQLQTDYTELRKTIVSQTGVLDKNPKLAADVTTSEYSVVDRSGADVTTISSFPMTTLPGNSGMISKTVYAFYVGAEVDLTIAYTDAAKAGVVVNEAGVNLLEGDGTVTLPAGKYMIQPVNFQPGDYLKGGRNVTWKEFTISSINIAQHDPTAHYHTLVLDSTVAATCTTPGEKVYKCSNADGKGTVGDKTETEVIPALGHSWGSWVVTKAATTEETGTKQRTCTRCNEVETAEIPKLSESGGGGESGGGESGGGSTAAGDYVLTFEGLQANDSANFFTVSGNYSNSKGSTTVNGTTYTDCLKMEKATSLSFTCNDGATLFMAFGSGNTSKKVLVDGATYTTDAQGTVTVENLSAGKHTVTKGDAIYLYYVSVANGGGSATEAVYYTLSYEYNYDDAPDAKTIQVLEYTSYADASKLIPATFTRSGYKLKGLYLDASCEQEITYPFIIVADTTFYADWEADAEPAVTTHSLIFNTNGGSVIATVQVKSNEIYELTQKPARSGYAFAGWYDALTGGNLIGSIDGSAMTDNYTVYAHWTQAETEKYSLNCATDLTAGNITVKTDKNGFTIHALDGTDGSTKKYMTVASDTSFGQYLGTNGVLLTDIAEDPYLKSIEFTVEGAGALTVEYSLSGGISSSGTYKLVLGQKGTDDKLYEVGSVDITTDNKTKLTQEFDLDAAGTYYLYATGNKGVRYYSLKVTEKTISVLYQTGINGTAPAGLENKTVHKGEVLTLGDCTPNAGYVFKGWSVDGGTTTFKGSYTVDEEDASNNLIVITAIYEQIKYAITVDAKGGTLPEGTEATLEAILGTEIALGDCVPATGYTFKGWSVDGGITLFKDSYIVASENATENAISIVAYYDPIEYTVQLNANGGTLPAGAEASQKMATGEQITLGDCTPADGYIFKGWSVNNGAVFKVAYAVKPEDANAEGVITIVAVYEQKQAGGTPGTTHGETDETGLHVSFVDPDVEYFYTGKAITPEIVVKNNGVELTEGVDYTVKYANNIKASELMKRAMITVTGKGNLVGKQTIEFTIQRRSLEDVDAGEIVVASGSKATPVLIYNGMKLTTKDYIISNPKKIYTKDAEDNYMELTGKGNYTGTLKLPVTAVDKSELKKFKVTLDSAAFTYTGDPQQATVHVTNAKDNVDLEETEYDVIWPDDIASAGTVKVYVVGKGYYTGCVMKSYKINPADINSVNHDISGVADSYSYDPKGVIIGHDLKVTVESEELVEGRDYKLSYSGNKKLGTAKYTLKFQKNYKGTVFGSFLIEAASLAELDAADAVKVIAVDKTVKKAGVYKSVPLVSVNGTAVKKSDMVITYYLDESMDTEMSKVNTANPTSADEPVTVYVKIQGKGAYAGSGAEDYITAKYNVWLAGNKAYDLSKAKILDENGQKLGKQSYNGEVIEPKVTVMIGSSVVTEDAYDVQYINNVNKGKATIVVSAREGSGYFGGKAMNFSIVSKNLATLKDFYQSVKAILMK